MQLELTRGLSCHFPISHRSVASSAAWHLVRHDLIRSRHTPALLCLCLRVRTPVVAHRCSYQRSSKGLVWSSCRSRRQRGIQPFDELVGTAWLSQSERLECSRCLRPTRKRRCSLLLVLRGVTGGSDRRDHRSRSNLLEAATDVLHCGACRVGRIPGGQSRISQDPKCV